jgi:DNA-binding SARP family transcriptional activator
MDIRVLGNVEIHHGTEEMALSRAGERCILATFALSPGHRVDVDTLIDHVWGGLPPPNAEHTIANYLRAVRRAVERAGGRHEWLRNHRPGVYTFDIDPSLVDYHRFTGLLAVATDRKRSGNTAGAITAYEQALGLHRTEALANITGYWADRRRFAIESEYLDAFCALSEQQLAVGAFATVASSVSHLIAEKLPTDRLILMGAHGLAGSGQHTAIPDFVRRASQRMWDTAQVTPSREVLAVAGELTTQPQVRFNLSSMARPDPSSVQPPKILISTNAAIRKKVFISYVREDSGDVDRIAGELRNSGIDVWLDRTHLDVGDRWKYVIRKAIREGDYFLACFSPAHLERKHTYMREELLVAIEELRIRPRDRRWFLPIVLKSCMIPEYSIGPGETLSDIHHIDFSNDWNKAIGQLIRALLSE